MLTTDASSRSREINWDYVGDAIPAFLTIIIIPLTYNIAYGVIAGIAMYIVINAPAWVLRKTTGLTPPNYDLAERWVVPPGGIVPGWIKYLAGTRNADNDMQMQQRRSPSEDERSHTKGSLTMSEINQLPSQPR